MNIAGNLSGDGMMRLSATSLVGEIGEPCMEWNISFKGSVSFFVEGQRKRWMLTARFKMELANSSDCSAIREYEYTQCSERGTNWRWRGAYASRLTSQTASAS